MRSIEFLHGLISSPVAVQLNSRFVFADRCDNSIHFEFVSLDSREIMSTPDSPERVQTFEECNSGSCRIETEGGTVYWLSPPETDGCRWVVREHTRDVETNTMVMQPIRSSKDGLDLGDKFKARLGGDIVIGLPFVLEVSDNETRILSEVVVTIELGNVPEAIFA